MTCIDINIADVTKLADIFVLFLEGTRVTFYQEVGSCVESVMVKAKSLQVINFLYPHKKIDCSSIRLFFIRFFPF